MTKFSSNYASAHEAFDATKEMIGPAMTIGFGSGRTIWRLLGSFANDAPPCKVFAASERTALMAERAGFEVLNNNETQGIDLMLDGADEFDSNANLVKGRGGALVAERSLIENARCFIVLAAVHRQVRFLGETCAIPVEVLKPLAQQTLQQVESILPGAKLRPEEDFFGVSEAGFRIIDVPLSRGHNPKLIASQLKQIMGVIDHGLFFDCVDHVITFND